MLSSAVDESMAQLRAQPVCTTDTAWPDLLRAALCTRQAELDAAHHDCRLLEEQLHAARPDWRRRVPVHLASRANGHVLHRDHRIALRSALGAFVGIVLSCALWIATAWSDGATAVSIIGTACVLFGTAEAPAGHVMRYLIGSTIGVVIGLFYALVIFPGLSDFVGLAMALAPALLLCGSFLARPPFIMAALGVVLTFPLIAGLGATNASNIVGALNSGVALFVGTAAALCSMSLLQTLDSNRSRARLQDVIRRDIARRAAGQVRNASEWTSRMVDRLALLAPRLRGHPDAARTLRTMFADMRAASAVAELRVIGRKLKDRSSRECHALLMHRATAHFRTPTPRLVNAPLLESLENTRDAILAGNPPETERVLALLSGLRRDLLAHED